MVLLSGSVFVLTKTGVLGEKAKIQWIFGRLLSGRCSVSTPNWWKMWVLVSLSGLRQPAHTRDQASSTLQTASTSSYVIGYWIHPSDKPNRSLRACRMHHRHHRHHRRRRGRIRSQIQSIAHHRLLSPCSILPEITNQTAKEHQINTKEQNGKPPHMLTCSLPYVVVPGKRADLIPTLQYNTAPSKAQSSKSLLLIQSRRTAPIETSQREQHHRPRRSRDQRSIQFVCRTNGWREGRGYSYRGC